jgi:hypothetical protein
LKLIFEVGAGRGYINIYIRVMENPLSCDDSIILTTRESQVDPLALVGGPREFLVIWRVGRGRGRKRRPSVLQGILEHKINY